MTLEKFIKENRRQIDRVIKRMLPKVKPINDAERKVLILNERNLLLWVEAQGVKIDGEWESGYQYDSLLSRLVRGEGESNQVERSSLRGSRRLVIEPEWKEEEQINTRDSSEKDPESLKSVLYYDDLPRHFTERAKELFPVVKKLFPGLSLKDWINGFKYDLYPEMELAKWEDEVKHYLNEIERKKVSPRMNKSIWTRILRRMNKEKYVEGLSQENEERG